MRVFLLGAFVMLGSTGCVTTAFGSADSPRAGWVYVVGADNAEPMVWLCPVNGEAECEAVEVTEDDE